LLLGEDLSGTGFSLASAGAQAAKAAGQATKNDGLPHVVFKTDPFTG
jgi:hypothetical protein